MIKKFLIIIILFCILCNITTKEADAIKIGLQTNVQQSVIATSEGGFISDNAGGNNTKIKIEKMKPYRLKAVKNEVQIKIGEKYINTGSNKVILRPLRGFVSTKGKWYRGNLIIIANMEKLTVINDIDLEKYLLGVVPSEMPSKWNLEAHKAQAIAARSYAVSNLGKRGSFGYDLKDTPEDQAYGGASAETKITTKAVNDTKGIVLTYNKKIIPAYYHASSGGKTTNSGKVWNVDLPYLRSVPSFDFGFSKNGHGIGMSQQGANNLANKGYTAYQILSYFYNNIHFGKLRPEWNL